MRALERWPILMAARRHSVPVVDKPFLTEEEERAIDLERTPDNFPSGGFRRASGLSVCAVCGFAYVDHPRHRPHRYLAVLCDGIVVKL